MNESTQAPRPWGLWPTIGFSFIIFLTFLTVQSFALAIYVYLLVQNNPGSDFMTQLGAAASDGLGISVSLIPGALAASLLVILFSYIRDNISVREYLHLKMPGVKPLLFWILILVLFAAGMEALNHILERPIPEWMISSYASAGIVPLFWITLVVAAPVFEELLFRGFLFEGLRYSALGSVGAVLITSALWAVIHIQYEWVEVVTIFAIGIIFGIAKIKTNSLYTVIILHALMNFVATLQVSLMLDA